MNTPLKSLPLIKPWPEISCISAFVGHAKGIVDERCVDGAALVIHPSSKSICPSSPNC